MHQYGYAIVDHDPDYVVVGEGRTFNLELVEQAVRMILQGAKLIATNLDPNCPVQNGLRPGCGAMVAMLEIATGVKAFSVGKPSPVMMRAARKELGLATAETTMIGDTMETDILGGRAARVSDRAGSQRGDESRRSAEVRLSSRAGGGIARRTGRHSEPAGVGWAGAAACREAERLQQRMSAAVGAIEQRQRLVGRWGGACRLLQGLQRP